LRLSKFLSPNMRVTVAVASCIGVGFVLQGCGGGGQDQVTSTTITTTSLIQVSCSAPKMDVVSQTISGNISVSGDSTFNGNTVPTAQMASFVEMFDFEKFNIVEHVFSNVEVKVGNKTMTVPTNTTQIVNIGEKQVIQYSSVEVDGIVTKTCVIEQLPPSTPEPAQLATIWLFEIKPLIQNIAVCGGNDGTYDTWKFNKSFNGPVPQIPNSPFPMDGLTIKDGSASEDVEMTEDHLLHASTTSVSGELLNGTVVLGTTKSKVSMDVTDVKPGGPSATDMDPSQFDVKCTPANTTVDLDMILRSPGFARQQLLSIMEASKKSKDTLMV